MDQTPASSEHRNRNDVYSFLSRRWPLVAGGLFAVLLIASIVLVLVDSEAELEAGTPEWTVQQHLKASEDREYETSYLLLSRELQQDCLAADYVRHNLQSNRVLQDQRVVLKETTAIGDATLVRISVTGTSRGDLFGPSEFTHDQTFTLVQESEEWRFSAFPWPSVWCGPETK